MTDDKSTLCNVEYGRLDSKGRLLPREETKRDVINVAGNSQALSIIRNALYEYDERKAVKSMDRAEYVLWRLIHAGAVVQRT